MISCTCFREESVERVDTSTDGLVTCHLAVKLKAMFETEQLPTCVADLDAGMAQVGAKNLETLVVETDLKGWTSTPTRLLVVAKGSHINDTICI